MVRKATFKQEQEILVLIKVENMQSINPANSCNCIMLGDFNAPNSKIDGILPRRAWERIVYRPGSGILSLLSGSNIELTVVSIKPSVHWFTTIG